MTKTAIKPFTIKHTFNAKRDRVWQAWTEQEHAKNWFGPKGCKITYHQFDLRPGGVAQYSMKFNGYVMHGKWAYQELTAPEKIIAIVAFTDETGQKIIAHPASPNWPLEMLSTVTFTAKGKQTEVIVEWIPKNPTDIELETFNNNHEAMRHGWGGSFDQLEAYLAE